MSPNSNRKYQTCFTTLDRAASDVICQWDSQWERASVTYRWRASIAETWQPYATKAEYLTHIPFYTLFFTVKQNVRQESQLKTLIVLCLVYFSSHNCSYSRQVCGLLESSSVHVQRIIKPETHCTIFGCPRRKIGIVKQSWPIRNRRDCFTMPVFRLGQPKIVQCVSGLRLKIGWNCLHVCGLPWF